MKPLFWRPIQFHAPSGSTAKNSVWEQISEPELPSMASLDSLFARRPTKAAAPAVKERKDAKETSEEEAVTPARTRPKVAKLIDPKRAQNLGIFISGNQMSSATVREVLISFDNDLLSYETLKMLQDYVSTVL